MALMVELDVMAGMRSKLAREPTDTDEHGPPIVRHVVSEPWRGPR
jgi:hypothetical protein